MVSNTYFEIDTYVFVLKHTESWGFPDGTFGKEPAGSLQETQQTPAPSLGGEDPLEEEMATHSSIFA